MSDIPLCRTCRQFQFSNLSFTEYHANAKIKRNQRSYCKEFWVDIEREATQCDKYDDKRLASMHDMEKLAYIMETKRVIGFDNPVIEFKKPEQKL